nr:MAG TPA: hypothetical protein [Caudoviricetes sp.]
MMTAIITPVSTVSTAVKQRDIGFMIYLRA